MVGRRDEKRDKKPIDLYGAELFNADLVDAKLGGATLCWANLTNAYLIRADLTKADLRRATIKTQRWDSTTHLDDARWSREVDPPKGWKAVDPEDPEVAADSRLLKRDDTGPDERDAVGPSA